jgi:lactate permease
VSLGVLASAGALPIALVFVLLVGIRWAAAKAMAAGWLVASVLGLLLWRMEPGWWAAAAVYGGLQALEIILIVFGAILLMNHLERSGAVGTIRSHFTRITGDRRIQLLLIGLGFITLIEGAAGFGTPGALAAPLMVGLGFPALAAAVFGLVFNAPQPPFGAAGTPVIGGVAAVVDEGVLGAEPLPRFLEGVTTWSAVVTGSALVVWGLVGVFLLVLWFGREEERTLRGALRGTLPVAPLALVLGALAGGTQFVVAAFLGPELPNIAAGFLVLGAGALLAARRSGLVPRESWDFPDRAAWPDPWRAGSAGEGPAGETAGRRENGARTSLAGEVRDGAPSEHEGPEARMPVVLAWTPYLLVAGVLIVTRWPGLGLDAWLRGHTLEVSRILGEDLSFTLRYLYLPGLVPFIPVALLTAVLHRMDAGSVARAWQDTVRQILPPAVTLLVAVSMTQVMIQSATNRIAEPGMMEALSRVVALGAGTALPAVSPWIGALGAFMTGSNTSSNVLFSVLQHDAAADVGVSRTLAVALQNVGGGIGNMLAVLNIAAVCGVLGMTGREGMILRRTLVPTVGLALFAGFVGLLLARLLPGLY